MTVINVDNVEVVDETPPPWTCNGCSVEFTDGTVSLGFVSQRGNHICEDCHACCPDCGADFNVNSGSSHASHDEGIVCHDCTRANYFRCGHCGTLAYEDDCVATYGGNSDSVCVSCYENRYHTCEGCDDVIRDDDSYHEDNCNTTGLQGYDYKPTPIFHHLDSEYETCKTIVEDSNGVIRRYRQIAYLGLELEMECGGGHQDYRSAIQEFSDLDDIIYLKNDGSLNWGIELVTHPMTLGWAMDNFPWSKIEHLGNALNFKGWDTDTAGIHVHVSRDGFTGYSHQAKFVNFITRNEDFFSFLAGRQGSRWASFDRSNITGISGKLKRSRGSERYSAVNMQNKGTLEVRIFKSSLKMERIQMALQLVDASVKYTESLPISSIVTNNGLSARSFIAWLADKPQYAVLSGYIEEWSEAFRFGLQTIGE